MHHLPGRETRQVFPRLTLAPSVTRIAPRGTHSQIRENKLNEEAPANMRVEYENPPVNELVLGVYFKAPILELRNEHIGLFWSKVRDRFPTVRQQPPLGDLFFHAPNEVIPFPRYWLVDKDEVYILQLQRNALLVNWRRQANIYPHFDTVKAVLDEAFAEFGEFIRAESIADELVIDTCEMTYVNVIEAEGYYSTPSDAQNVIPSFRLPMPELSGAVVHAINSTTIYQVQTDLLLALTIKTGSIGSGEPSRQVLVLEQRASGQLAEGTKSAADRWFNRAHEVTGTCFNSITDSDIQSTVWKRRDLRNAF